MPIAQVLEPGPGGPPSSALVTPSVELSAVEGVRQEMTSGATEEQRRRRFVDDPRAIEEYYHELGPLVLAYLRRRVPPQDAEDVLQQVFLDLWRSRGSYDATRPMIPWVLGIAHKRSVDHLRRQSRASDQTVFHISDAPRADAASFAERYADAEYIRQALADLSPEMRETLVLAYFADMTQSEIAVRLGVPLGTVKARSHRGLRKLAASLVPEEQS